MPRFYSPDITIARRFIDQVCPMHTDESGAESFGKIKWVRNMKTETEFCKTDKDGNGSFFLAETKTRTEQRFSSETDT
jgi:hypothetical protein